MYESTKNFVDLLKKQNMKYEYKQTSKTDDDIVLIGFNSTNLSKITLALFFNNTNQNVAIRCFNIVKCPEDKIPEMLKELNDQNNHFRYTKFTLDPEDNSVQMMVDGVFSKESAGAVCFELVMRSVSICNEVYPSLVKATWE